MKHPWRVTLREFIAHVEHVHGVRLCRTDRDGYPYLETLGEPGRYTALPGIDLDDGLELTVLKQLCRGLGLDPSVTFQTDRDD